MRDLVLLMGDMLFPDLSAFPADAPIWMSEDWGLCTRTRHHRHKITLFLSAMRHRAGELGEKGRTVIYTRLEPGQAPFFERLAEFIETNEVEVLHTFEPNDRFALAEIEGVGRATGVELVIAPSPGFLTTAEQWARYRRSHRRLFMAEFYKVQRLRLGILMDGDQPAEGRWSFDTENRKPLPKGLQPPAITLTPPDPITQEVAQEVDRLFPDHAGQAAEFRLPVTREGALRWLDEFVERRLAEFGPYEDAISRHHRVLFHGLLTPFLNCGLLTPHDAVHAALRHHERSPVPIASLEGFLRQVIGWREFIKGVDREYRAQFGDHTATLPLNALNHTRQLKPCWWTGETGLPPLDTAILRAREFGWIHHIERLMVVGSAMLLVEAHPDEAYRWFMEMVIDSADWVMAPNVYGMSQFADGGLFATKPYISASAYLRRMSDFPAGDWCDVWDGLYWQFVDRHRDILLKNPRLGPVVRGIDRLTPDRRAKIFGAADRFIARTTT